MFKKWWWLLPGQVAGGVSVIEKVGEVSGGSFIDEEEEHLHGDLVDTVPVAGRHDLTDEQWRVLEPLLSVGRKPGRPSTWMKRQLIAGIRRRTRAGAPWREVPPRCGEWNSVYGLFRRWRRDGTWARILAELQARERGRVDHLRCQRGA